MNKILIFNSIIIFFWIIIFFTNEEWRFYIIKSGFFLFIMIYTISWTIYYKYYSYKNDFFDDFFVFFNYFKEKISKYKIFTSQKIKDKKE